MGAARRTATMGVIMSLRINSEAPNFTAETTQGTINFHDWIGDGWAVLFSHPKDFTPVCTTELGFMAGLLPEFQRRNTKIIGLSIDPVGNHARWAKDIEETQGHAVTYPMIGDTDLNVAKLYDMLPEGAGGSAEGRTAADNATRARGVRHRPGQENQDDADLSDDHRPQLRRSAAHSRLASIGREAYCGDPGELASWRRRHHPTLGVR
jgi:peroxiredoxin